jgi:GxxExxY protein
MDEDTKGDKGDPQTYAIIGAAMEVHRQLGHGFLESVYQEAMALELVEKGIPFEREVQLTIYYKGKPLKCTFKADFVCYGDIILETKALSDITGSHRAQTINYLAATRMHRGLIINFGLPSLRYERFVWG